jgi:hypothetical protein
MAQYMPDIPSMGRSIATSGATGKILLKNNYGENVEWASWMEMAFRRVPTFGQN